VLPGRLAKVPPSSFERLAALLEGVEPKSFALPDKPVAMTVGEPQDATPEFITRIINETSASFSRYPPMAGTPQFRAAVAAWLARRFAVPVSAIDAETMILPLNGSREGLFSAMFPLVPETKAGRPPVVLVPNPFYTTYPAAAIAAGAEVHYVPSRSRTGFLPDFASVPESVLARTSAAFFCSPSNPESACATAAEWHTLFALADRHDFVVLADECYCEIYDRAPPMGSLTARHAMSGDFKRLLSFHSLSKRSTAPGLRSGFVFGPPELITPLRSFRNTSGPQVPIPVLEASTAAWADETHVETARALYRERFTIAERILGNAKGFRRPPGGFYLWLDVGDGPAFAKAIWSAAGVRVMPGAFMGIEEIPGDPASNPGHPYVRIALVHDSLTIAAALDRLAEFLRVWNP
jgi:aspartate/methionine/tyrosine aminotransferase